MRNRPDPYVYALAVEPLPEDMIVLALANSGRASEVLRTHRAGRNQRCCDPACRKAWPCAASLRAQRALHLERVQRGVR